MPPTAMGGSSFNYYIYSNLIICFSVLIIYLLTLRTASKLGNCIWCIKPKQTGFGGAANSAGERNKHRTLQSLFIIMCIYASGWFFSIISVGVINAIGE
jgi:hypothetical protein